MTTQALMRAVEDARTCVAGTDTSKTSIDSFPPQIDFSSLNDAARRYGIPENILQRLKNMCVEFATAPNDKRIDPSNKMVRSTLEDIAKRAKELKALLDNDLCSTPVASFLSLELWNLGISVRDADRQIKTRQDLYPEVHHLQRMLCTLAASATRYVIDMPDDGSKGGRPKSKFGETVVSVIAYELKPLGIAPSKSSGKFLTICEACFQIIGIHANPEGAIRSFMRSSTRQRWKEQGLCL